MNDRTVFDSATRAAAGDEGINYDNVAVTLHWLTALLVITQFALALHTVDNPIYYAMHKSVKGFKLGAFGQWFFVKDMYIEK